ncbi:MAG: serine/threonine protein kinase [Planctomycetes bacterium]|nr:serine/threonine protein kinase [Planctomycetota bacterium]
MRVRLALLGLCGVAMCGGSVAMAGQPVAGPWAQFRGPRGLATSAEKGLPTRWGPQEGIAWKAELPGGGASTPIILGDRIFLTCFSGYLVPGEPKGELDQLKRHVVCLSRRDGKLLWSKAIPARMPEERTIREHGYAANSVFTDGERAYAFLGTSGVFAYDLDGKQLWQANVGSKTSGWGTAASPIRYGELLIINASVESESLIALDRQTGKEKWRAGGIRESWNTPILVPVGEKAELVLAIHGKVLGFDPDSGEQLWSSATDIGWYMVPSIVAGDGVVYCIGGRGTGGALAVRCGGRGDVTATHRLWTLKKGSNVSSPILHEGHVYWAHENEGILFCVEAKTGRVVYEERLPRAGQFYASPVLAVGKLYYTTRDGRTYVVAASPKFQLLATNELGRVGVFNASPAVANGQLFLRADKTLFCIGSAK